MIEEIKKQYYSIGEVIEMIPVSHFCIHEWCKEFDIDVLRNRRNDRRFTPEQVLRLKLIYIFMRVEMLTIRGTKQKLKTY